MNPTFTKKRIALYSLAIGFVTQIPATILRLSSDVQGVWVTDPISYPIYAVWGGIWVFLFWVYVRWVASTAEKAGRSYVGFMLIAILFAPIAWLIVLMFKKPSTASE